MRSDGRFERRLSPKRGVEAPDWSPNGRRIAFHHGDKTLRIALVNADGTRFRNIPGVTGRHPRWSPDGRLIAFVRSSARGTAVMVVRPDGTGRRVIARRRDIAWEVNPAWSPDGRHILFAVAYRYDEAAQLDSHQFLVASLTGSPVRRIAISGLPKDDSSEIYGLDWTPRPFPRR